MSKTGQWLLQMQEDAEIMTREEFISEHCLSQVHIWEQVQEEADMAWAMAEQRLEEALDAQGEGE